MVLYFRNSFLNCYLNWSLFLLCYFFLNVVVLLLFTLVVESEKEGCSLSCGILPDISISRYLNLSVFFI